MKVAVLDCGSRSIKAGFSGENVPRVEIPTVIGHDRHGVSGTFVGANALTRRASLDLCRPIQFGRIDNWDDMEQVWDHLFTHHLYTKPDKTPTILTETTDEHPRLREKKAEIFFEKFQVPQFSLALQSVLSLYSVGRTCGLVVDLGDGHSNVVPVVGGLSLKDYTIPMEYCGYDDTIRLLHSLKHMGFRNCPTHIDIAYHIKETCCYVRTKPPENGTCYTLPDKSTLNLTSPQLSSLEVLFTGPNSIQHTIQHISQDMLHAETLADNIVLSGGGVDCTGFTERLKSELSKLGGNRGGYHGYNIIPNKASKSKYSTWLGASILSSLSTFSTVCVSSAEYFEYGAGIINRRNVMELTGDQGLYGNYSFSGG